MRAGKPIARWISVAIAAGCLGIFIGGPATAQTNERAYESLEFRVVTPGARAVAMGKTFIGIADDATAAASNPAGLSNLLQPEVSIEWSGTQVRHTRMVTLDPLQTQTFTRFVGVPTFASYVRPLPNVPVLRDITIAAFYNALQRYKEAFNIPNFIGGQKTTEGGYFGNMHIYSEAWGFGASFLATNTLSVGGSLTLQHLKIDSTAYSGGAPPAYRNGTETDDSDLQPGGQAGLLWKPVPWLSIGAAYYAGTTFHLTTTIVGVFSPENSPPLPALGIEQLIAENKTTVIRSPVQNIDYRIPDRFTVGGAYYPHPALTVLADAAFVRYSQRITPNFLIVDFLAQRSSDIEPSDYSFANVVELHGGVEYRRQRGTRVVAFRTGLFIDPDHQMRFKDENPADYAEGRQVRNGQSRRFNGLDRSTGFGWTGGAGLVLGGRFQVDGAVSLAPNAREVVLSTVFRFQR